jgi:phage terminase small subunit
MRGRRPKPTRLKLLTGNPGKRPLNETEPRPEAAIPECPVVLGPVARQEWDRLVLALSAPHPDSSRSSGACGLLRRLHHVVRGH